jgi:hypothetical protein
MNSERDICPATLPAGSLAWVWSRLYFFRNDGGPQTDLGRSLQFSNFCPTVPATMVL